MTWAFDDSVEPPFLVELTDESSENDHQIVEMTEAVIEHIAESTPTAAQPTAEEIRQMILAGMVYGWQFAQQTVSADQTIANRKATAKRRKVANERHKHFRAAWESAITAGRDVSIAELARELGVPRATAYRAVHG
jgi:hypothetical protein